MKVCKNEIIVALLIAAVCVVAIDSITNELDIVKYSWDFKLYIDMAENGLRGNPNLLSPFAYRFATPLLARCLTQVFRVSTKTAFTAIAYLGAIGQLVGVFLLARYFKYRPWIAVVCMLIVAFSMSNVKFLVFDVYRPDHLAYPLMILAMLAVFEKCPWACVLLSILGLQFREFLAIPAAVLMVRFLVQGVRDRSLLRTMCRELLVAVPVLAAVVLPRLLIPVAGSVQSVDPLHDPAFWHKLLEIPADPERNLNILFRLMTTCLPILLVLTRDRIKNAWRILGSVRLELIVYTGLVVLLTMYGGTDIGRFLSYLFVPCVLLLGAVLQGGIAGMEIIFMLIATLIFNKILMQIPIWDFDAYLAFFGGYSNRLNFSSFLRWGELIVWFYGGLLLRAFLQSEWGQRLQNLQAIRRVASISRHVLTVFVGTEIVHRLGVRHLGHLPFQPGRASRGPLGHILMGFVAVVGLWGLLVLSRGVPGRPERVAMAFVNACASSDYRQAERLLSRVASSYELDADAATAPSMKRCRELDVAIIENSETMTPRYAGMAEGLANERRVIMDGQFSYVDDRQNVTNRGKAGVTVVYVGKVWPLARWRIDAEYGF